MPEMPIGVLVRLYRIERRRSVVSLATHAGITARYLEMIKTDSKDTLGAGAARAGEGAGGRTSTLLGEAPSMDIRCCRWWRHAIGPLG
ncbi:MAG: hypothetical protein JO115_02255 [Pseudonocardiales bacterium]|nr:hypothetical protein [Pseudonocardiales bacterium]